MAENKAGLLFQPGRIGPLEVKNRIVRSATYESGADKEGFVTDELTGLYQALAQGGSGMIITGHAAVVKTGIAGARMMRAYDEAFVEGLARLAGVMHEQGDGVKAVLQLSHPGRQIMPGLGVPPVAPSDLDHAAFQKIAPGYPPARGMSRAEIEELIEGFGLAAANAKKAGFDAVQVHAAHGWLLSSFLSPHVNQREDEFGGSTEGRALVLTRIREAIATHAGAQFPVLAKLNTTDHVPGGMDVEEAVRVALILERAGYAAIETSGGSWEAMTRPPAEVGFKPVPLIEARTGLASPDQESYYFANARAVAQAVDLPVILVGGNKTRSRMEEILASGAVDFISMCRPLIRQPDLPRLMREGLEKAECLSCNACLPKTHELVHCPMKDK